MNDFIFLFMQLMGLYIMAMILKVISIWKLHQTPHADTSQMCTLLRNIKFLLKLICSCETFICVKTITKETPKMYNDNWKSYN